MIKKNILKLGTYLLFTCSVAGYAQMNDPMPEVVELDNRVGVNTMNPQATLHIAETLTVFNEHPITDIPNGSLNPQGVLFPTFTTEQLTKFGNVTPGTMVYNIDKDCIQVYKRSNSWDCLCSCDTPLPYPYPQPEPQPSPQPEPPLDGFPLPPGDGEQPSIPEITFYDTQTIIYLDNEETSGIWQTSIPYNKTGMHPIQIYDNTTEENYPNDGLKLIITLYGNTIYTDGYGNLTIYIEWKLENPNHIPNDKIIPINIAGKSALLKISFSSS